MEKRWIFKEQFTDAEIENFSRQINNLHPILTKLLLQRGINTREKAVRFFKPQLSHLHDPFLMKDMDKAVLRLSEAIVKQEKILVYGDYDVDGTSSVALVYSFIRPHNKNIEYYIPDRYNEGYGLSEQGIDYAHENNFKLIIALDCGIKAVEMVDRAKEYGIDVIICDHHRPGTELPRACAVLDPKREDCNYPFKELSACGVGFKLVHAYAQKFDIPIQEITKYLDLVTISIASDIVPIVGENRVMAYFGLKIINTHPRPGIEATILQNISLKKTDLSKIPHNSIFSKEIKISDLVFTVGPRINAAGRMDTGRNSVKLLISKSLKDTLQIGNTIKEYNEQRKEEDKKTFTEAMEQVEDSLKFKTKNSLVVYNPQWHKGVIGIVASRLVEKYYKPTIVLTGSDGMVTGSARSVKNFDIYDAIESCKHLLEHFGGHKYAAGMSILPENLDAFIEEFEKVVGNTIEEEMKTPEIEIDSELDFSDASNPDFYDKLKLFEPFGPENMSPIFYTNGLYDSGNARVLGSGDVTHLKMGIVHQKVATYPISAIAFGLGHKINLVRNSQKFSICYHVEENVWNERKTLQFNIKGIRDNTK